MFRSMITRLVLVGLTAAIVGLPEVALGLPRATSEWVVEGHERNASFGTSVASAGDVNGDGYDDVVVGAPLYGPGDPGAAFLFLGSAPRTVCDARLDRQGSPARCLVRLVGGFGRGR